MPASSPNLSTDHTSKLLGIPIYYQSVCMTQKGTDNRGGKKKAKGWDGEAVTPHQTTPKALAKDTVPDDWEDHWEGQVNGPPISGGGRIQKAQQD
ncbi:hypothetical protein DSO57_1032146 [Entomophthora muscae]|uniref:Uncharacterized protein n=1 Tax=Entomophthora muscae TaxID=34485 RepID=A0ACC2SDD5_9FUNG|nr:hypothetical protein DSO57_1032146 [Entomophthora muscae]